MQLYCLAYSHTSFTDKKTNELLKFCVLDAYDLDSNKLKRFWFKITDENNPTDLIADLVDRYRFQDITNFLGFNDKGNLTVKFIV